MQIKLIIVIFFISGLLSNSPVFSQPLSDRVELEELGLSFNIGSGWTGQLNEDAIFLGHQTIPGFIILTQNNSANALQLKQLAMKGIYEQGISLNPQGEFKLQGNNRVEGIYSGLLNDVAITGYAIGLINGLGAGINILIVTEKSKFTEQHKIEANKLAKSVQFFQSRDSITTLQWKNKIVGQMLKYITSKNDSDYTGGYTSTSTVHEIDLCSNGYFYSYSNVSNSFSEGEAGAETGSIKEQHGFGFAYNNGQGQGTYIISSFENQSILTLKYGEKTVEYDLSYSADGATFLDDSRYFVIDSKKCN